MRRFWLGAGVVVLVVLTGSLLHGQERSGGAVPPQVGSPTSPGPPAPAIGAGAQLGSQRSVAPPQPAVSAAQSKRAQQVRGLVALVLLTLIVIAFLLFLMVLTARWTRLQLPKREARKTTSLEDLWSKVRAEPASDEEIARMLSEDTDKEKPKDGEEKTR